MYVLICDGVVYGIATTRKGAEAARDSAKWETPTEIRGPYTRLEFGEPPDWNSVSTIIEYGSAGG